MALSITAREKLEYLKSKGITPTAEDIVSLHTLGLAVDDLINRTYSRERGLPVTVGNCKLWAMTCRGSDTWREWLDWFGNSAVLSTLALAFILAHGRGEPIHLKNVFQMAKSVLRVKGHAGQPEKEPAVTLDQITDRATALRAIMSWFSSLTCTLAELDSATSTMLGYQESGTRSAAKQAAFVLLDWYQDDPERGKTMESILADLATQDNPENPSRCTLTWRQYCNEISVITGTNPEYWMDQSCNEVVRCYALAMEHDAAKAGGETEILTETEKAIKALNDEFADILNRHTAPKSAEGV